MTVPGMKMALAAMRTLQQSMPTGKSNVRKSSPIQASLERMSYASSYFPNVTVIIPVDVTNLV